MNASVEQNKFEALKIQFLDQTQRLYRMTLIDLQIFTGYITFQLVLGGWIGTNKSEIPDLLVKIGLMIIDLGLTVVAMALLFNNYRRREVVVQTTKNCSEALGYEEDGAYLVNRKLNAQDKKLKDNKNTRYWISWYLFGIILAFAGVVLITFSCHKV